MVVMGFSFDFCFVEPVYANVAQVHASVQVHSVSLNLINPCPAGPLDFPPHAGGVLRPPDPLSRLLGHVATRGKRHSKGRQKS